MAIETNTVVIGAGPGGYVAAIRLGQLGVKTLIIEKEFYGGVCLNVGCIPSKALITAAKHHRKVREGEKFGIIAKDVSVDAKKLMGFKEDVVKRLTGGVKQLLKANKVDMMDGTARFKDKNTLEVTKSDGKKETVRFKNAIIATGSRPIQIPGFEYDNKAVLDSTGALALQKVPKRLIVIGGGYIGLEIACMYHNLGTEVEVVEMMPQLLTGMDEEVTKTLHRSLKKRGMKFHMEAKAQGVERTKSGVTVGIQTKDKKETQLKGDHVLVAVGRSPNTRDLGLEKAGLKPNDKGIIETDAQARTNIKHIHAIGDITQGPPLAHKASKEGIIAAEVIAGKKSALDHRVVPAAVFTDPEIASVGKTEEQLKKEKIEYKVGKFPFAANGRALGAGEGEGFTKILADKKTEEILGVHIIGPDASDLIAEATLGIEMGGLLDDVALTIHTHPTLAETLMEAAEHAQGHAIHTTNR
jgi:dihydrolipoamide dehydrogenase